MRILLAEDDHNLGTWLSRALEHAGIQVEWVNDGRLADRALQQHDNYDALILTARDSLDERVRSLNAGADDFLAKPFELAELEARLHALVRRARGNEHPRLACGALVYDNPRKQFTLHGEPLALSPREHAVLRVLVQRSGEPFSKQQILDRVFSDDEDVHPEAVEVFVHRLRKRLDGSGVRITTLRGLGHALGANDVAPPPDAARLPPPGDATRGLAKPVPRWHWRGPRACSGPLPVLCGGVRCHVFDTTPAPRQPVAAAGPAAAAAAGRGDGGGAVDDAT